MRVEPWRFAAACAVRLAIAVTFARKVSSYGPEIPAAFGCQRLPTPPKYTINDSALFNPAAAWIAQAGWMAIARHDRCRYNIGNCDKNLLGEVEPVMMFLGNGSVPNPQLADNVQPWGFEWESFKVPLRTLNLLDSTPRFGADDYRPFAYQGQILVAHSLYWQGIDNVDEMSKTHMALSVLDWKNKVLVFHSMFPTATAEKNWGFIELGSDLLIIYKVLPRVVILQYSPASQPFKTLVKRSYLLSSQVLDNIAAKTGFVGRSHNSGHPVLYMHSDGLQYLLVLVHARREHRYWFHWAVLIDIHTFGITHMSLGPVLRWHDCRMQGFLPEALVVSSYHLYDSAYGSVLRTFFGEGDKYCCSTDIPIYNVNWLQINSTDSDEKKEKPTLSTIIASER
ncbi:hypothetical protein WJX77_011572 [Trebouxia sp. C0004]